MSTSKTSRRVTGTVRLSDGSPARGLELSVAEKNLRSERVLGEARTERDGRYAITYAPPPAAAAARGADLVVKVHGARGTVLATSVVLFDAPESAVIDVTIPADALAPPTRFEAIASAIEPLLGKVAIDKLDENAKHQDVTLLAGQTGFDKTTLARFLFAHRLADTDLPAEFWFVLLGGAFFQWTEGRTVAEQLATVTAALTSLDAGRVRNALARGFAGREIAASFEKRVDDWVAAFASFAARQAAAPSDQPTFLLSALDHAGIRGAARREAAARALLQARQSPGDALDGLEQSGTLTKAQIADLQTSYRLADIIGADFAVVRTITAHFDVHRPDDVASLARQPEDQWVAMVKAAQASGDLPVPSGDGDSIVARSSSVAADTYGRMLARQIRDAFPTAAFAGGLERAVKAGAAPGFNQPEALSAFLDRHPEFDLARSGVDAFLDAQTSRDDQAVAKDPAFRSQLKAAQRVHKLATTFEASSALLADGLHSAQQVYRIGESEFVRRYGQTASFTIEDARRTWRRAADTHAAVLTIVGDLKALDAEALPQVLQNGNSALATFPNWQNLFAGGDLCSCDECNSVLSPAAYFADLLMFLKDRSTVTAGTSVKDLLLERRPDLGFLELGCDNALTPLPYIDVVCEVLEAVVAAGASDIELPAFTTMPADPAAARAAVAAALATVEPALGADFSLIQVTASDPDRWVAHGDEATWLLKKKATPNFFAEILRNTKGDAEELRAYPEYVNATAYQTLRQARFPFALPFDLFGEEVRAAFEKISLRRSELMQSLRGPAGPSDGEMAADYFGIGVDSSAAIDEKRLILVADPSIVGQQTAWGEPGNAAWLDTIANVKTFLGKTGLEYEELGALIDLAFVNAGQPLAIEHLDASCDTAQKRIDGLDPAILDRMHRFLRLWRKLTGWQLWELDLAIRCTGVGNGTLDESCLVNLHYFARLRARFGKSATVSQVCALFQNLSTETHFVQFLEPRADGLYQSVFLNKRVIQPLDPAFAVDAVSVPPPTTEKISGHRSAILSALGVGQLDLDLIAAVPPITDDLTLDNLTRLWRHAWLAKRFAVKTADWLTALTLLQQTTVDFASARDAWAFVERMDQLRATGFSLDQLDWILNADRSAKAAAKEADATRFLTTLRTGLQAIRNENDPARYPFLSPPSDTDRLTALLTSQLQQLHRDEAATQFFIDVLGDKARQTTPVTGLPAGFTFPAAITSVIPIGYDEPASALRFGGLMTAAAHATLLTDPSLSAVTAIASYQSAVEDLFERPRLALKFLDPIFTAPLAALPAAVDFAALADPALAQKISYDAEARDLEVIGILSAADKASLDALSNDTAYRAALDTLFTQPRTGTFDPDVLWLSDADLQFPLADNLNHNLATAIGKALAYLSRSLSETLIVRSTSAALGLTEVLARHLVSDHPLPDTVLAVMTGPLADSSGVVDDATLPQVFDVWYWAGRVAVLWNRWKLTVIEWQQIRDLVAAAQLLDVATLPLTTGGTPPTDPFLRLARLLAQRDALPETDLTLLELLTNLHAGSYASVAAFAADVERVNGAWSAPDVEALIAAVDLAYPADYLLAEHWERVRRVLAFGARLNGSVATLETLAGPTMAAAQAATIKQLLRSGLDPESWRTLSAEIQDALRERKRDALTAYLLSLPMPADAPSLKWENANDLYAYYLLDVEMGACQLTSRLVQGAGSVQLLVQRCFMGLEPQVRVHADGDDGDSAWRWWDWMRKYRVWEANRKIFLWPENWIEPELRRERSEIFKELEQALLQNDVTSDSAETAFTGYVEKVAAVAQLEVAGFYQEDAGDDTIVHVIGRTPGTDPHVYYYRRFDYRQWTAWEKVNLDIKGDYLSPAVFNTRLFLFWPVFTEVSDEASNSTVPTPVANESGFPIKRTAKHARVQLALSDYRHGQWTPKKVSKDFYQSGWLTMVDTIRKFYQFVPLDRSLTDGRSLVQFGGYSLGSDGFEQAELFGTFDIATCTGVPELGPFGNLYKPVIRPEWASVGQYQGPDKQYAEFMKWNEVGKPDEFGRIVGRHDLPQDDFTLEDTFAPSDAYRYTTLLLRTPWFFRMTPGWQLSYGDRLLLDGMQIRSAPPPGLARLASSEQRAVPIASWLPFFYNDKKRTFFVEPAFVQTRKDGISALYYPEVKAAIRKLETAALAQAEAWVATLDPSTITPAERQSIDAALYQAFPEEAPPPFSGTTPPPYTPAEFEQVKRFIVRLLMRFSNAQIGLVALNAFHLRRYRFKNFYHPFVCEFLMLLQNPLLGIPAMMRRDVQLQDSGFSFKLQYQPTPVVLDPSTEDLYPHERVDFRQDEACAPYNWELFFHAPLLIANALSRNQRFSEARDWYHYIFNPIGVESATPGGSAMSKYWITKPFYETTDPQYIAQRIENILRMLAGDTTAPGYSPALVQALESQVADWRTHPFEPHRIAAYRTVAYQKTVVMKYLDNLIAWGDNLFRQDSMESINEATQLYVLAAELLGPRPMKVPPQAKPPLETFNELEASFDAFSNALIEVENLVPPQSGGGSGGSDQAPLPMLYFCVPQNDILLAYWDTVADRLYKIRHCMNIEGIVRQLALFEPPIEPGALVKPIAGGVDLGSAIADLTAPLPLYRFQIVLQIANQVCSDVRTLGTSLASALEAQDAEALARLRQGQEIQLLQAMRDVKARQLDDAQANLVAAQKGRDLAQQKVTFYMSRPFMNTGESLALALNVDAAALSIIVELGFTLAATTRAAVPQLTFGGAGFGGSPVATETYGGGTIADSDESAQQAVMTIAGQLEKIAAITNTIAAYQRRSDEWGFQADLAQTEVQQAEQMIAAAQARVDAAQKELDNHDLQIANAQDMDEAMRSKFTNLELFQWQVGQISQVYFRSYQLAYDLARRAERCFRFELGLSESNYISFGYWDNLKRGLLAGEQLQYDLRRLESAYLEQNRREFELTKHVSLLQLDPVALVRLRETGRCFFDLPEEIFDLDYPGHYFRRIKSVSLTLPCVTGPYTTVSCTLRLLRNSIRITTDPGTGYPRNTDEAGMPADDPRFVGNTLPLTAIAASGAQNDSGMFELNFRDERYLPFEGAGAVSSWSLELFNDQTQPDFGAALRQFDYDTITDAVLHVRFTAREDAGVLKNAAIAHLRDYLTADGASSSLLMLNLRRDFPSQWSRFINPVNPAAGNVFELDMSSSLFQTRDAGKTIRINSLILLARCTDAGVYTLTMTPPLPAPPPPASNVIALAKSASYGGLHAGQRAVNDADIEVAPTGDPVTWRITATRPGGGNLIVDPTTNVPEMQDLMLIAGYVWS